VSTTAASILRTVDEIDCGWLTRALACGAVASFTTERIGTGQMSESHRVALRYADEHAAGPGSIVVKLASADATSRATGVGLGIYAREIAFYTELAPRIGGPLARCHAARIDEAEGWFTLVLEDITQARQGDQIAGCEPALAELAVRELARLHAPVLGDRALAASAWLNRDSPVDQALVSQLLPGFLERYGERITSEHRALCERFVSSLDAWLAEREEPLGLVHGDFRLDNLLFGERGCVRPLTVVDWQTVGWGPAMHDVAYFLGGGLTVEDRRACERDLLREYHSRLLVERGAGMDAEHCWREYRRLSFAGVLMAIVAPMLVERTERGDQMFVTMLARHAQHALDLDARELLAGAGARRAAAPRPSPQDEGRHAPGAERLWNESWYFDVIDAGGTVGAYVRVGLYPNLGVCWYTTFVCPVGGAPVAAVDFAAPLPAAPGLLTETGALRAEHVCEIPLERFRVTLDAIGEAHADAAAPLRGEPGTYVPVSLDLSWETDGEPYGYRLATRYEIPCRVTGTIRVGEERFTLSDAPGQRDHSWGTRDWWSMDWMWSACHLADGAHLHAVQLRLADEQRLTIGYEQSRGRLRELERIEAREHTGPDGLIVSAQLTLDELALEVEPLAFGALRLVAPDGRVSHFPRAMCRVSCEDGRSGLAWIEWNLNQPSQGRRAAATAADGVGVTR
jgi:hypothetical protein